MMVIRANAMTFNAPSPQLSQMLVDLLNHRITPVVQSRGSLGEGDLAQLSNVGAAMVGAGDAYYQGTRMTAAEALAKAGLKPIQPFAADTNALTSSDAYGTGIAALVVDDERYAPQHGGAEGAAIQVAELGSRSRTRHDQGQLFVQRRSAPDHSGPGEPAGFFHPPGIGVARLGRSARCRGSANELIGSQPCSAHRFVAAGFVGAVHASVDEVLRQGRQAQQR